MRSLSSISVNPLTFFKIAFVYSLGALPPIERLVAGRIGVLLTIELKRWRLIPCFTQYASGKI